MSRIQQIGNLTEKLLINLNNATMTIFQVKYWPDYRKVTVEIKSKLLMMMDS